MKDFKIALLSKRVTVEMQINFLVFVFIKSDLLQCRGYYDSTQRPAREEKKKSFSIVINAHSINLSRFQFANTHRAT